MRCFGFDTTVSTRSHLCRANQRAAHFEERLQPHASMCAAAFVSDLSMVDVAFWRHGMFVWAEAAMSTSLEHTIWFHSPFSGSEWLLYERSSPCMAGSRGLVTGRMWRRDGTLVASVVQATLIRMCTQFAVA